MPIFKRILWVFLAVVLLGTAAMASVGAEAAPVLLGYHAGLVIPPGFDKVSSVYGAQLYRKDYSGGTPDFVQTVDLSQGAAIKLLHGSIKETRPGHGAYGGNDPRILSRSLEQYWKDFASSYANPFCVVNGQFFYMPESPTRLPFALKVDGEIVSDGFGKDQFPGQKLMLELWPGHADIQELTRDALYSSSAPNIVAGLSEVAHKAINKFVGRTFVGLANRDGDGQFETVLILTTRTARQVDAADVLRSFGAQKVMMLDGGGSTQMICLDKPYISSDRLIPQALGVQGGTPPTPKFKDAVQISSAENAPQAETPAQAEPPQAEVAQAAPAQTEAPKNEIASNPPDASQPSKPLYNLSDILWVPGIMAPAVAFILLIVLRMRFS